MYEPTEFDGVPDALSVAIVDDASEIRMLLRAQLQSDPQFHVCAEGGDGTDAVAIAREWQPDVMLLDLSMPHMDGLEALPSILAESPRTAVVVLSAGVDDEVEARAAALGAVGCLTKTLRAGPLPLRLHGALGTNVSA